ncbi:Beta-lactamase [compost metagenome]
MNLSHLDTIIPPLDLRSCLISHRGKLIYEHYRNTEAATDIAKINSCTKSIVSALICIAMNHDMLPDTSTPITEFFPQLRHDNDSRKKEITLEQLLTMTAGFDWTEFGGDNSFPRMTRTANWVEFALAQPLRDTPGTRMEYNSGISQLLTSILVQASGMSVAQFAERHLFGPLGITAYSWEQDPQGIHTGGFGLWMRPDDLLKFGELYLQQGVWEGQTVISRELVTKSTQPAIAVGPPWRGGYGWHWWSDTYQVDTDQADTNQANTNQADSRERPDVSTENVLRYYYARGYGGQFVHVIPQLELVTVLTNDKRKRDKPPTEYSSASLLRCWRICSGEHE